MMKFSTCASALAIFVTGGLVSGPAGAQSYHVDNYTAFQGQQYRPAGGSVTVKINRHFGIVLGTPTVKPKVHLRHQPRVTKKKYKRYYYAPKPAPHRQYRKLHKHNGHVAVKPRLQSRHIPYKGLKRRSFHRAPHSFYRR